MSFQIVKGALKVHFRIWKMPLKVGFKIWNTCCKNWFQNLKRSPLNVGFKIWKRSKCMFSKSEMPSQKLFWNLKCQPLRVGLKMWNTPPKSSFQNLKCHPKAGFKMWNALLGGRNSSAPCNCSSIRPIIQTSCSGVCKGLTGMTQMVCDIIISGDNLECIRAGSSGKAREYPCCTMLCRMVSAWEGLRSIRIWAWTSVRVEL